MSGPRSSHSGLPPSSRRSCLPRAAFGGLLLPRLADAEPPGLDDGARREGGTVARPAEARRRPLPRAPSAPQCSSTARTARCRRASSHRHLSEPQPDLVGHRHARGEAVVVRDEDALRLRDDALAGGDHVLEVEALRADPRAARAHLDLLPHPQLGAEVDLHAREDEAREAAEHADPRLLEVGRVDGVVDVAHRVAVAEADLVAVDERARRHRRISPRRWAAAR